METRLVEKDGRQYVDCLPGGQLLTSEADALDLVAACGEHGVPRLMLHAENLSEAFYDLRTRLAGSVMLKFTNYWIKVAAVLPAERLQTGRFAEMAVETRLNREFRIFTDLAAAETWLLAD